MSTTKQSNGIETPPVQTTNNVENRQVGSNIKSTQIGSIKIVTPIFLEKLQSTAPAPPRSTIPEPAADVVEISNNNYHVNIFAYLLDSKELEPINKLDSAIKLNDTGTIWLQYFGLKNMVTLIPNEPRGTAICRCFKVVFNAQEHPLQKYPDLYRISFNYSITEDGVDAEAIFVQSENIDPKTSRGTVTTIRKE